MAQFLKRPIPLYGVFCVFLIVLSLATYFAFAFRETIYTYQVFVPATANSVQEPQLQFGSWPALSNPDFFKQVRESLITQKTNFIEADLSTMQLSLYEEGVVSVRVPIATKGKQGSWWQTPAGLYQIETKEKNHFSTFGKVYQPWSLAFQGNFFIHGWPYYSSGEPVSSKYSGGCIRLATNDAQAVFEKVKVGMPVLVFEEGFQTDALKYQPRIAGVSARSYMAADLKNNFVFTANEPSSQLPVASLTKLVTAMVAIEYINIEREIPVDQGAIVFTSHPRLKAGQKVSLYNLLHLLLAESSNEAAEAIAQYVGRDRFISLMNKKAHSVGMNSTVFTDPSGSDPGNVSSAQDLFNLAKYLYNNRSFILRISAGQYDTRTYGPLLYSDLENFNVFTGDSDFIGGKVGKTEAADETIVSIFETEVGGIRRPVVLIVLGSQNSAEDARQLLSWVKGNY